MIPTKPAGVPDALWEKAVNKYRQIVSDNQRHLEELAKMPRKALAAAALLGDFRAQELLDKMTANLRTTIIVIALIAGATSSGFFAWEGCNSYTAKREVTEQLRIKADQELQLRRMQDAATLRATYVKACKVTPDQAEQLVPDGQAQATPRP